MDILNSFKMKDSSNNKTDQIEEIKKGTPESDQPIFIIVMGGVCTGKTTFRLNKYSSNNYTHIDAGEIFIELSEGEYYDFPSHLEDKMNQIGITKMRDSIRENKNIVIEIIGANNESVKELMDLSDKIKYSNRVEYLECDLDVALLRNQNRGDDNISAYYSEPYNIMWFKQAAIEHLNSNYPEKNENSYNYNENKQDNE